ncbi:MAG: class I SAM-dependent methyltransferase [Methylococcales bacterium]
MIDTKQYTELVETAARRYWDFGRFVHGFARGKLLHDPVYRAILELNVLPEQGKILDLGCGRGILLALLTTRRQLNKDISPDLVFKGIELRSKDAQIAQVVLGAGADIVNADIRSVVIADCQLVILLDVLLYMREPEQKQVLQRIADALPANGTLIMREADASASLRYLMTWGGERFCALSRGHWLQSYHYRSQHAWVSLLEQLGFTVTTYPMSEGTPFANVLFVAKRNASD